MRREQRLHRVAEVVQSLHDLDRATLARLEAEDLVLAERQVRLLSAHEFDGALAGLFVAQAARRMTTLVRARAALATRIAQARDAFVRSGRMAVQAHSLDVRARRAADDLAVRRDLEDMGVPATPSERSA
jgi:hypothetical protein